MVMSSNEIQVVAVTVPGPDGKPLHITSTAPDGLGSDREWMNGWTIFYWGWWIAWAPFVGMFIAKISRGRTVRQIINGSLTGAPSTAQRPRQCLYGHRYTPFISWFMTMSSSVVFRCHSGHMTVLLMSFAPGLGSYIRCRLEACCIRTCFL